MDTGRYWFPAKRYGWGWGMPTTWQGWVVHIFLFVGLVGGMSVIDPRRHRIGFFTFILVMLLVDLAICYVKGEPPRWRRGNRK